MKKKRKLILFIVLVLIILVFVIVSNISKVNNTEMEEKDSGNYVVRPDGSKESINERVLEGSRVKYIEITNVNLIYVDGISKYSAEILNTSDELIDLNLKIYFMDKENEDDIVKKIDIGKLGAGNAKEIEFDFPEDLSNTYMIRYEIID